MCGIVGTIGTEDAVPVLLDGLRRLEYRGYDSAGIAVLAPNGAIEVVKREGKLDRLVAALADPPAGTVGVGHTRWATHGAPSTLNAHPHGDCAGRIAVVHNGIIENYGALRADLARRGHELASDTDTEVIAHLVEEAARANGGDFPAAVRAALGRLEGAYAIVALSADAPDTIVAARRLSPLIVGTNGHASYVASDIPALLGKTRHVRPLEDGEVAVLDATGVTVTDLEGAPSPGAYIDVTWDAAAAEKGGYPHFVRKEIAEQPEALRDTLRGRLRDGAVHLPELDGLDIAGLSRAVVVAAGTSYYAGLVAKQHLERWARLPVEVAVASEFRYGAPVLGPDTLVVLVTQSGETADTLAAQRLAKDAGSPTLALTNVVGSSVTRGADASLYLQVGPEIGVVATKTFTGQLALLTALAADVAVRRGRMETDALARLAHALAEAPDAVAEALAADDATVRVAEELARHAAVLFIGRGLAYPIALEAALKLKEVSYIHAEGYPAGELKHGPIALLEPGFPVVAFVPAGRTRGKTISNIEEVRARGARVIAVATAGDDEVAALAADVLWVPEVDEAVGPMVWVVPAQLVAYHAAVALGRDVDQPRNLAKSVTVE